MERLALFCIVFSLFFQYCDKEIPVGKRAKLAKVGHCPLARNAVSYKQFKVPPELVNQIMMSRDSMKEVVGGWLHLFQQYDRENKMFNVEEEFRTGLWASKRSENLDNDPENELFVTINASFELQVIYILDHMKDGWYCIFRYDRDTGMGRVDLDTFYSLLPKSKIFSIIECDGWRTSFYSEVVSYFKCVNGRILKGPKVFTRHFEGGVNPELSVGAKARELDDKSIEISSSVTLGVFDARDYFDDGFFRPNPNFELLSVTERLIYSWDERIMSVQVDSSRVNNKRYPVLLFDTDSIYTINEKELFRGELRRVLKNGNRFQKYYLSKYYADSLLSK